MRVGLLGGSDDGHVVDHDGHVGHCEGFAVASRCCGVGANGTAWVVGVEDGGGAGMQTAGDGQCEGVG